MKMKRVTGFIVEFLLIWLILGFGIVYALGPSATFATQALDATQKVYSLSGVLLAPGATPTDVVLLWGATGSVIHIKNVSVSGIATTAGSMDVSLVKRTAPDTGGTVVTSGTAKTTTPQASVRAAGGT